jgi:Tol biopolymer transport system component
MTFGTTQEEAPAVAADGRVVFASVTANLDEYSLPLDVNRGKARGRLERLTREIAKNSYGSLSTDGRLMAYHSYRNGQAEIWLKDLSNGKERMLASGSSPVISPDGALIAFPQENRLMIIPSAGGAIREISSRPLVAEAWSPDQSLLVVADYAQPRTPIEIIEVASGKSTIYLSDPRRHLYPRQISPDGRWIAFIASSVDVHALMIAPFRPAAPPAEKEWVAVDGPRAGDFAPHWSSDGRMIYFISDREGFGCIWAQRLSAEQRPVGPAFPVLHLHGASLRTRPDQYYLSVAKDKLVIPLEERSGGIWMLQFK